jgi:type II secretory pathway pseudopilin PulG
LNREQANSKTRKAGASLIELLVVLAVMAILMSLILVAIQRSREAARRAVCQSNLHQISVAMRTFVELKKRLPDPAPTGEVGGWTVELLPFLEESSLGEQLDARPMLVGGNSSPLLQPRPEILSCPSAFDGLSTVEGVPATHYAMDLRNDPPRNVNRKLLRYWYLGDVATDCRLPWAVGPELELFVRSRHHNPRGEHLKSGPHSGGFHVLNSDEDAVRFVTQVFPPSPAEK